MMLGVSFSATTCLPRSATQPPAPAAAIAKIEAAAMTGTFLLEPPDDLAGVEAAERRPRRARLSRPCSLAAAMAAVRARLK